MSTQILSPFPLFTGITGAALNLGYVYIGEDNQDPETHPQDVFWDEGMTIPATQPLRTNGGYIVNAGDPASLYTADTYSIRVRDKNGVQVFYRQSVTELSVIDANGHMGLGTAPTSDAVLTVETEAGAGLLRGIAVEHYADTAGSYGVDIHSYQGAKNSLAVHHYSNENGAMAGGTAVQFDHTRDGAILALVNARNPVTSPGTTGTAHFLSLSGYPNTADVGRTNLLNWTYQNIILTPENGWPLTVTGSGMVINAVSTSPRGLLVNQGATGIYASVMAGINYGFAVSTTTNGGQTFTITKNGTGNGSAAVIVNEGTDPSIAGIKGGVQGFAIYPNGDFYHGTDKVIGARDTGWTPMTGTGSKGALAAAAAGTAGGSYVQADFQTALNRIAALEARMKSYDSALTGHGLIGA